MLLSSDAHTIAQCGCCFAIVCLLVFAFYPRNHEVMTHDRCYKANEPNIKTHIYKQKFALCVISICTMQKFVLFILLPEGKFCLNRKEDCPSATFW